MEKLLSNEVLKQLDDYAVEYAAKFYSPEFDKEEREFFNRMLSLKAFSADTEDLEEFLFSDDEALEVDYRKVVIGIYEKVKATVINIPEDNFDTILQLIKDFVSYYHLRLLAKNKTKPNLVKLKNQILDHIDFLSMYLEQAA